MFKPAKGTPRSIVRAVVSAAILTGVVTGHAHAEEAKIKSASFSLQPVYQHDEIVVTSSDGSKWDTISSKTLKLSANMVVDTKHPGYVKQLGILLGGCHNTDCYNNPVMFYEATSARDINVNRVFNFPGNKIPVSSTGVAVPSYGDEILNACNNNLQADGATKTYSFNKLMTASFSANTGKAWGSVLPPAEVEAEAGEMPDYNGGDVTRQAQFAVKVTCKAHEFKVGYVSLSTSVEPKNASQQGSGPATGRVSVKILANRGGALKFKLFRDDGASQTIVADADTPVPNDASGRARTLNWEKTYNLTKSVDRKYMVVLMGHKYSTPWKPMVLKCGAAHDAAGPDTVSDRPNPTHGKPVGGKVTSKPPKRPVIVTPKPPNRPLINKRPTIKVAPLPRVVCIGGKVSRSQCFCPARTKKVTTGPNRYRCVVATVKPNKLKPRVPLRRATPVVPKRMVPVLRRQTSLRR